MVKDYSKGKIYKIVSDSCDDIYIGSTVATLAQRLGKHRGHYKEWKKGKGCHTRSFSLLERGDYHIILIEPFPCANQEELTARERWHIENNVCLNKAIPGRTHKEWLEANKEKVKEQSKKYREANKDKIKEQTKEYREKNKDKIKEQRKKYSQRTYQCLCDGENYSLSHKSRHLKSQYHISNLKSICDIHGVDPSEVY